MATFTVPHVSNDTALALVPDLRKVNLFAHRLVAIQKEVAAIEAGIHQLSELSAGFLEQTDEFRGRVGDAANLAIDWVDSVQRLISRVDDDEV